MPRLIFLKYDFSQPGRSHGYHRYDFDYPEATDTPRLLDLACRSSVSH